MVLVVMEGIMTVRTPLCFDASAFEPMTLLKSMSGKHMYIYLDSTAPTVTVTVVSSSVLITNNGRH